MPPSIRAVSSGTSGEIRKGKDLYATTTEDQSIRDSPDRHTPASATLDRARETPPLRLANVLQIRNRGG